MATRPCDMQTHSLPNNGPRVCTVSARCRSLDADVRALERLALRVAKSTRAYLHCESQKGLMSVWWAPVGAAGMWVVAALMRGRIVHKVGKDH